MKLWRYSDFPVSILQLSEFLVQTEIHIWWMYQFWLLLVDTLGRDSLLHLRFEHLLSLLFDPDILECHRYHVTEREQICFLKHPYVIRFAYVWSRFTLFSIIYQLPLWLMSLWTVGWKSVKFQWYNINHFLENMTISNILLFFCNPL